MPLFKQHKYEIGLPYLDSAVKYDAAQYLDYRAFMKCIFQKSYQASLQDFYAAKALNGNIGLMDHPYDFYIALCHLQLNDLDSAANYLDRCIAKRQQKGGDDAVHYMHWFYRGVVDYVGEDYQNAIQCLDKCLKQYPNFADAKYYKAHCMSAMRQYQAALNLMLEAKQHLADGYTINEDNVFYEYYPYQIVKVYVDGNVKYLKERAPGIMPK